MFEIAAVDDERHSAAQIARGVSGPGRARPPREVGAGGGERTHPVDQRRREGVCWMTDGDAVQPRRDPGQGLTARHDQRERAGPEAARERDGQRRESGADRGQVRLARDVHDERVVLRPALDREHCAHGAPVGRARGQPVDRLGWDDHGHALTQPALGGSERARARDDRLRARGLDGLEGADHPGVPAGDLSVLGQRPGF